jgi:hypothetical protein
MKYMRSTNNLFKIELQHFKILYNIGIDTKHSIIQEIRNKPQQIDKASSLLFNP